MPKITAKQFYAGADVATGEEFSLEEGESRDVSAEKAEQLKRDFPDRFDFHEKAPRAAKPKAKASA